MIYIREILPVKDFHAGNKARNDAEKIFKKMGIKTLNIRTTNEKNLYQYILYVINMIKGYFIIPEKKILINQYPQRQWMEKLLRILKKNKGCKLICLIHDIEGLRQKNKKLLERDIENLKKYDFIISHNKKMSEFLEKRGIEKTKLINLDIFDYLLEDKEFDLEKTSEVCFAGNLNKSLFIYDLDEQFGEIKFDVFGINFIEDRNKSFNMDYKGAYPPDIIHEKLSGKYGLIWDGNSIETCNGEYGEYLEYNNPHKMSLYIAAGIPIVTWRKAAIASYILEKNIGIVVDSLLELKTLKLIKDESQYELQVENVKKIKEEIIKGNSLKNALIKIRERIEK